MFSDASSLLSTIDRIINGVNQNIRDMEKALESMQLDKRAPLFLAPEEKLKASVYAEGIKNQIQRINTLTAIKESKKPTQEDLDHLYLCVDIERALRPFKITADSPTQASASLR